MDQLNAVFLNILRSALKGEAYEGPADLTQEEWLRLMDLAQSHHVLPMVFQAAHALPGLRESPIFPTVKQQVRRQVILQARKSCDFLALNQQLRAAGIRPLVVKGIICRELYPYPDHRGSSDEDVLILESQTGLCHSVLSDYGMETTEDPQRFSQVYEIPYRKKDGPLYIELHRHLFPPESEAYGDLNRFFEHAFDRAVTQTIQGVEVSTLDPTDHLFYLICHAFKHFLHSGFGIRQVCDIVLFANTWGSRIDWQAVLKNCKTIRADRFAAAIFRIGEKDLAFDPEKACYPPQWQAIGVDEGPMLEDLLSGGLYGDSSMSRKHSSSITLDAVTSQKRGKKAGNAVLLSLFPSAKKLESQYPYLKERPYLLPAAWAARIQKYHRESKHAPTDRASQALKIGSQRTALLKEYGIIE